MIQSTAADDLFSGYASPHRSVRAHVAALFSVIALNDVCRKELREHQHARAHADDPARAEPQEIDDRRSPRGVVRSERAGP